MNYYSDLGILQNANEDQIKKAYRKKAFETHPDRNLGENSAKLFKTIQEAYEILIDPLKRSEYDRKLGEYKPQKNAEDFAYSASRRYKPDQQELDKVQCQFFGGNETQGRNVLIHIMISSSDLRNGTSREIKWKKRVRCKKCDGYGVADLNNCDYIKCSECDGLGKLAESLRCDLCSGTGILDHFCKFCKGIGLFTDLMIEEIILDIPPATSPGSQIIIRGRGEDGTKGTPAGNLHVIVIEDQ